MKIRQAVFPVVLLGLLFVVAGCDENHPESTQTLEVTTQPVSGSNLRILSITSTEYHFKSIMFYVYLLRSKIKKNQLYVGYTEDLEMRLKKHNAGEARSTKPCRPWDLVYYEAFTSKKDAKQREQY